MKALFALIPLVLIAACDRAPQAAPSVAITDVWCRAAPEGAPTGGCYATLTASADDQLVSVETTAAERAEIHSMDMEGGVMRMRKLDGLALPAGDAVKLAPGGEHLMLIGPTQPLAAGTEAALTFKFGKAPAQSVRAPIRAAATGHSAEHSMDHGG